MAFSDPQHNIDQLGITEGARVADLGSGAGFYTLAAAKKTGPDGRVYAIDVLPDMLDLVRAKTRDERVNNVEVIRGNLEKAGGSTLRDNFVDIVIVSNVLFQVEHKEVFLKEAHRILKPGGRLLLVDWRESFGGMGPTPAVVVLELKAKALLEGAGFSIAQSIRAGDHHYGMIARKT